MARPGRAPIPRLPFPGGAIRIRVTEEDSNRDPELRQRVYSLANRTITVERRRKAANANELAADYAYDGLALGDVWPGHGAQVPTHPTKVAEMVIATRALCFSGVAKAKLYPHDAPDVLVDLPDAKLAIEVTEALDPREQQFQHAREDFVRYLNSRRTDTVPSRPVSIGFVKIPEPKHFEKIAALIDEAIGADAVPATFEPTGSLREYTSQIQLIQAPVTPGEIFSGAGVVNHRGHPDLYRGALERIEEKRLSDYSIDGRSSWLAISLSEPLIGPDFAGQLFATDINLGRFDRIIIVTDPYIVTFSP